MNEDDDVTSIESAKKAKMIAGNGNHDQIHSLEHLSNVIDVNALTSDFLPSELTSVVNVTFYVMSKKQTQH